MKKQHSPHLLSVKGSIMRLLIENPRKWFSSRAITAHLQVDLGRDIKPTCDLLRLVKSSHVLRAYKPRYLTKSKTGNPEMIYKWSGKPYRDEIERISQLPYDDLLPTDKAKLMRCLSAHYPNLPLWYRRMML
ncbi:MAG: hypothetical protein KDJ26_08960 [Alphaproteobacteria bacterium]|nr:hypothetical protein [Alphaproteobacteria bacterium]MCB9984648.1 hypothetical protein [Micavibrio sp.]